MNHARLEAKILLKRRIISENILNKNKVIPEEELLLQVMSIIRKSHAFLQRIKSYNIRCIIRSTSVFSTKKKIYQPTYVCIRKLLVILILNF